jgi:hypothetical protein
MSDDGVLEDFKQISISKVTLGLILGVICFSAVITWNAAQVANRIDDLERAVDGIPIVDTEKFASNIALLEAINAIPTPPSVDLSGLATSEDVRNIHSGISDLFGENDEIRGQIEDLEEAISAVELRLEEIGWELGDLWWRTDMGEQACRTKTWCDDWYNDNGHW